MAISYVAEEQGVIHTHYKALAIVDSRGLV